MLQKRSFEWDYWLQGKLMFHLNKIFFFWCTNFVGQFVYILGVLISLKSTAFL